MAVSDDFMSHDEKKRMEELLGKMFSSKPQLLPRKETEELRILLEKNQALTKEKTDLFLQRKYKERQDKSPIAK